MKRCVMRIALPFWVVLHFVAFRSAVFTTALLGWLGPLLAGAIVFAAVSVWSVAFYLLLCQEESFDRVREYLARLQEKEGKGALAKVGRELASRASPDKPLFSFVWIMAVFVFLDPLTGVLAARLAYPGRITARTVGILILGSLADVVWWLAIMGPPAAAIRAMIGSFWAGG